MARTGVPVKLYVLWGEAARVRGKARSLAEHDKISLKEHEIHEARSAADLAEITALAHRIWHEHYPAIISHQQIEHMLAAGYTPEALAAEQARGARFLLAREADRPVAYAGWSPDSHDPALAWLDKLYVASEARGAGLARTLLCQAIEKIDDAVLALELRVNRHNTIAIAAYERLGFVTERADIKDIGHGFVMDDLIMRKTLQPPAG